MILLKISSKCELLSITYFLICYIKCSAYTFFFQSGVWRVGLDISSVDECVCAIVAGMGDVCVSNHVHLFVSIPCPVSAGPG